MHNQVNKVRKIGVAVLGLWVAGLNMVSFASAPDGAVKRIPLHDGWKFSRAALSTDEHDFTFDRMSAWLASKNAPARMPGKNHRFVKAECDEAGWREVTVPHDWGIEGAFDAMQGSIYEANLDMTGVGWYRRKLRIENGDRIEGLVAATCRMNVVEKKFVNAQKKGNYIHDFC